MAVPLGSCSFSAPAPAVVSMIRGGVYSTNRRFLKMGRAAIVRFFLSTALHSRRPDYFRSKLHEAYWEAY